MKLDLSLTIKEVSHILSVSVLFTVPNFFKHRAIINSILLQSKVQNIIFIFIYCIMSTILVYKLCGSNYCCFWEHGRFLFLCPLAVGWNNVTNSDQWIIRSTCCHLRNGSYNCQREVLQHSFTSGKAFGNINSQPGSWDNEEQSTPLPCDACAHEQERNLFSLWPLRFPGCCYCSIP